jgi:hypothetical protein
MPITKLQFRPGINKETTSYSNKGGWNDCDLVRFRFGYPEKLGGWEKYSINTFLGSSRSLHSWANLQGNNYLGIGTEIKFYIEESQGYRDITPLRRKVVSSQVVFDLGGLTIVSAVSGSAGTGQIGNVVVFGSQDVPVLARNPDSGVLSIGTGEVGTVTINIPPTSTSLTGTTGLGSVTVSITNESTVTVGGS